MIELPAGLAGDVPGAKASGWRRRRGESCWRRRATARRLQRLFHGPPSAGLTSEEVTFFLARDVEKVAAGGGDTSESIVVHTVPLDRVPKWLRRQERAGKAIDLKVYAGLYALAPRPS